MAQHPSRRADRPITISISTIWMIVILNSIVVLTLQQFLQMSLSASMDGTSAAIPADSPILVSKSQQALPSRDLFASERPTSNDAYPFGLVIPKGRAKALPSIPISEEEEAKIQRNIYGGKGDKAHLGGFTRFDPMGVSPTMWKEMVNHLGIKSLVDVGCGRGISTSWFITHGLEYVVCAEGSHDAVTNSLIPKIPKIPEGTQYELVEHDFSRGPWWPERTVDVAWCVEFTEHVGRNYMKNYHTAFRKAALIFATHSNWGGWHHVEVHGDTWWIIKMESMGFVYSEYLTREMRVEAKQDHNRRDLTKSMMEGNNTSYNVGQHLWNSLQVFINPLVASLPEHQHLFAEHGCFDNRMGVECGKGNNLTPLPERFKPLQMTKEMDDQWLDLIKEL